MRTYPGLLTNAVRSALRSKHDLMLENLALRQQLAVLTRQRARTRTKPADRLFWSWLSRYWPGWRSTLVMVQPETVIRWHRTAWRGSWGGKTSCGPPILMMQTSWHRLAVDSLARHPLHRLASLRRVERQ